MTNPVVTDAVQAKTREAAAAEWVSAVSPPSHGEAFRLGVAFRAGWDAHRNARTDTVAAATAPEVAPGVAADDHKQREALTQLLIEHSDDRDGYCNCMWQVDYKSDEPWNIQVARHIADALIRSGLVNNADSDA